MTLTIGQVYEIISDWIKENYREVALKWDVDREKFEFHRVLSIPKMWKEGDMWILDATIEFTLGRGVEIEEITLQIDVNGKVVGYNLREK
ncbi:MAG: hypothetical protein AOA65_1290 [Candidatus Bathyarchaeota archaeon BA1]|nr:MAG: hypothetical protein AOA65_1290 [Candidatus Bathyarchaeota archaeon BA1]